MSAPQYNICALDPNGPKRPDGRDVWEIVGVAWDRAEGGMTLKFNRFVRLDFSKELTIIAFPKRGPVMKAPEQSAPKGGDISPEAGNDVPF